MLSFPHATRQSLQVVVIKEIDTKICKRETHSHIYEFDKAGRGSMRMKYGIYPVGTRYARVDRDQKAVSEMRARAVVRVN